MFPAVQYKLPHPVDQHFAEAVDALNKMSRNPKSSPNANPREVTMRSRRSSEDLAEEKMRLVVEVDKFPSEAEPRLEFISQGLRGLADV